MSDQKKYKSSNPVSWTEDIQGIGGVEAVHILFVELFSDDEKSLKNKNKTKIQEQK